MLCVRQLFPDPLLDLGMTIGDKGLDLQLLVLKDLDAADESLLLHRIAVADLIALNINLAINHQIYML